MKGLWTASIASTVLVGIVAVGVCRRGGAGTSGKPSELPPPLDPPAAPEVTEPPEPVEDPLKVRASHLPRPDDVVLHPLAEIMKQHGAPELTTQEDLDFLDQILTLRLRTTKIDNFENKALSASLAGLNLDREALISPDHHSLNSEGLLVDRYGTPYRFENKGENMPVVITTAGPDRQWGNNDDVHRDVVRP